MTPPTMATRISTVNTALPAITRGWRALLDHFVGMGTRSGSSAARGLRGLIRLVSLKESVAGAPRRPAPASNRGASKSREAVSRDAGPAPAGAPDRESVAELARGGSSEVASPLSAIHPT